MRSFLDLRLERASDAPFWGKLAQAHLGAIGLSLIDSVDQEVHREPRDIARTPHAVYFVNVQLAGTSSYRQGGEDQQLAVGDFAILDATRPFMLGFQGPFQHATFMIPHAVLAPRLAAPDGVAGTLVRASSPLGGLISSYLRTTAQAQAFPDPIQSLQLSEHIAGLLAVAFGAAGEAAAAARPDVRAARLRQVRAYIDVHLADELAPASITRALGMSPRYLHGLFEPTGETAMRYVVRRRLEHCHAALRDPAHRHRSIAEIAFAWGFADLSHFGRAFRAAYGKTPRDHRHGR